MTDALGRGGDRPSRLNSRADWRSGFLHKLISQVLNSGPKGFTFHLETLKWLKELTIVIFTI